MPIPKEFEGVKEGDTLTVKRAGGVLGRRSGESGYIVKGGLNEKGAGIDFLTCGQCGAASCPCYMSIEFWEWHELEPLHDLEEA